MVDDLDLLLDEGLPKGRKCLTFIKRAYDCGAQSLVNRSITDKLLLKSGLSFHIGTDDPTMRRVASWLLTNYSERSEELIKRLWKRSGREDIKLIGLLIANIEGDAWGKMLAIIDRGIPIDLVLEIAEEIKRSGREVPSAEYLTRWNKSKVQKQNAVLIASLDNQNLITQLLVNQGFRKNINWILFS